MNRLALAVILIVAVVIGSGSTSVVPLTRTRAEQLIKQQQSRFADKVAFRLNTLQIIFDGHFSEDQLSRRVPTDYSQLVKGSYLEQKFADILEKAGLLKIVSLENKLDPYRNQLAVARYTCVSDPDLEITNSVPLGVENFVVRTDEKISFWLVREHYSRITGVVQEKNRAIVQVETIMTKTAMYKKFADALTRLGSADEILASRGNDRIWWDNTMVMLSAINQKIDVKQTYNIPFVRFDDGWRIAT